MRPAEVGDDQLLVGESIGHFRVIERLGAGGMGVVWLAEDEKLGRRVALKVLRSEIAGDIKRRRRFMREARNAATVTHPNIAVVHEIGEDHDRLYLVMEYIEGRSLRSLVRNGPLSTEAALEIAYPMAQALGRAHEAGIVHRDLKPENVMLGGDGQPKLLDFGIAKVLDTDTGDDEAPTLQTAEGAIVGTPSYMSPEQALGSPVDQRSDVFSFGVVLYEMLAGVRPFIGEGASEVVQAIIRDDPPSLRARLPALSPALEQIVRRCLEKRAADRYKHGRELARELGRLRERTTPLENETTPFDSAPTRDSRQTISTGATIATPQATGRRRWPIVVAAAAVLAIAAAVIVWRISRSSQPTHDAREIRQTRLTRFPPEVNVGSPLVSSDGQRVVVTLNNDVWVQPFQGLGRRVTLPAGKRPRSAAVLPDGRFVVGETDLAEASSLWLLSADGRERRQLVAGPIQAFPSPDGTRIAYRGTRGIDVRTLASGDTVQVAPAADGEQVMAIAWSPAGDRLAWVRYGSSVPGGAVLETAPIAGGIVDVPERGRGLVNFGDPGVTFAGPNRLLFTKTNPNESGELFELDLVDGRPVGTPRSVLRLPSGDMMSFISASPTGDRVVALKMTSMIDVVTLPIAPDTAFPAALRRITLDDAADVFYDWSADGASVVFGSTRLNPGSPKADLFQQPLTGGDAVMIAQGCGDCVAAVSGDRVFVVVGEEKEDTVRFDRRDPNGSVATVRSFKRTLRLRAHIRCSRAGCFFGERDGAMLRIREMTAEGEAGAARITTELPAGIGSMAPHFSPSPDGRSMALVFYGDGRLRVVGDDGRSRDLVNLPGAWFQDVAWAPDGKKIYITAMRCLGNEYAVVAADLDGKYELVYVSQHQWVGTPRVSPDGTWLGLTVNTYDSDVWQLEGL